MQFSEIFHHTGFVAAANDAPPIVLPRIIYTPEQYGTVEEFERNLPEHEHAYREMLTQFKDITKKIGGFLESNGSRNGPIYFENFYQEIRKGRSSALYGRSEGRSMLYNPCLIALNHFSQLLDDKDIPLEPKILEAQNLSELVNVCGPGVTTSAEDAVSALELSRAGFLRHVRKQIIAKSNDAIIECLNDDFLPQPEGEDDERREQYDLWEKHLGTFFRSSAARNYYGPLKDPDARQAAEDWKIKGSHVRTVRSKIEQATVPSKILREIADNCLEAIRRYYEDYAVGGIPPETYEDLVRGYIAQVAPELSKSYGAIPYDDVFSVKYAPSSPDGPQSELPHLASNSSLLKYRLIENLTKERGLSNREDRVIADDPENSRRLVMVDYDLFLVDDILEVSVERIGQAADGGARTISTHDFRPIQLSDLAWIGRAWHQDINDEEKEDLCVSVLRDNGVPDPLPAARDGNAGDIRTLTEKLKPYGSHVWNFLGSHLRAQGDSVLDRALRNGHAEVISIYCDAIRTFPTEQQREHLQLKEPDGWSRLAIALAVGHTDAIAAYARAVSNLPPDLASPLLSAGRCKHNRSGKDRPGLEWALRNGHADTIRTYAAALTYIDDQTRAEQLIQGAPGLFLALKKGRADAIRAYGDAIRSCATIVDQQASESKEKWFGARNEGDSGLAWALEAGHADAIRAYGEIIRPLIWKQGGRLLDTSEEQSEESAFEPVRNKHGDEPALTIALRKGQGEAAAAYMDLLEQCDHGTRVRLLEAGAAGFSDAIRDNNVGAVDAYLAGMRTLQPTDQAKLLKPAATAMADAMSAGHQAVVKAYADATRALDSADQRYCLTQPSHSAPGILHALREGHLAVVKIHADAMIHFDASGSDKLLKMVAKTGIPGLEAALRDRNAGFIASYGEYVQSSAVDAGVKRTLLLSQDASMALLPALRVGDAATVSAYAHAIRDLPNDDQLRILSACDDDFGFDVSAGLRAALSSGHADAVAAYRKAIAPFRASERFELLEHLSDGEVNAALWECLSRGHTRTVEAYAGMVADLGGDLGTDKLVQLLSAPARSSRRVVHLRTDSASIEEAGFTAALRNGHSETAEAFIRGLQPLDKVVKFKVLKAPDKMGTPLLMRAVREGDAAMIKTYADAIAHEDPDLRVALLRGTAISGSSGMHVAIRMANDGVIEAYEQAIMHLPPLHRDRLLDEENRGQSLRTYRQTRERASTPTRYVNTDTRMSEARRQPPGEGRRLRSRSRSNDTEDGRSRIDGSNKRQRLDEDDADNHERSNRERGYSR